MPDLSDTVAKCRIGTAKNFTLLLLLYHTKIKSQGMKQLMAGGGVALIGTTLVPLLSGLFGYDREFYEAHRDMLALRSAAKKAFDAYKKENGSDKKLPRISELNAEYAMLLERKKSSYAEYRKTKSEMQDWLVAQKIVQEILKEDEQKKEQLHEQEVMQEEENRQSSR